VGTVGQTDRSAAALTRRPREVGGARSNSKKPDSPEVPATASKWVGREVTWSQVIFGDLAGLPN
jgi:hypothetical protein